MGQHAGDFGDFRLAAEKGCGLEREMVPLSLARAE
jgi:hypothetical protein